MPRLKARVAVPLQYSDIELEARVSHAKLDTEFEARLSTPPWHPNANLKTPSQTRNSMISLQLCIIISHSLPIYE